MVSVEARAHRAIAIGGSKPISGMSGSVESALERLHAYLRPVYRSSAILCAGSIADVVVGRKKGQSHVW